VTGRGATLDLAGCVERFAAGEPVLVAGEDEAGAVVALAASTVSPTSLARLYRLGGDTVVLAVEGAIAGRLELGPLAAARPRHPGLALAAPIDAADCRSGGWSLRDRAHTITVAVAPGTRAADLRIPGHVHTAPVADGAQGAPSAAVELARESGHPAAAAVSAVLDRGGRAVAVSEALRDPRLRGLAAAHGAELRTAALARELERTTTACTLPTRDGRFRAVAHMTSADGEVVIALTHGDPASAERALVHAHSACLLGDTFASRLCDCRYRLERATAEITHAGTGIILYSKPVSGLPFTCGVQGTIDATVAAGLLRHARIGRLRLTDGSAPLASALAELGLDVDGQPR
jgi:3,4-dihydroxy 2-butanone 4-phosphate synthase/GTP cyclohydrolase II